jgi:hypothetical protein
MIKQPCMRWTRDTETAFLLALRRTGAVGAAVVMIGREKGAAYRRRANDPGFAQRWDDVLAECRAEREARDAGAGEGWERHGRYDGLGPVRRRAFLRALSETGEIQQACARVGTTQQTIWNLKKKSPDFAAACEAALARALPCLEQVAWERAVEGWDEPIVHGGKVTGTRRRYSETLLRTLLVREQAARQAERVVAAKARTVPDYATPDETDTALLKALDRIAQARRREAIARADAWQEYERAVLAGERPGLVP